MIKTILTPVDLSENARVALEYAIHIGHVSEALVLAYHAYHIKPGTTFIGLDQIKELEKKEHSEAKSLLNTFVDDTVKDIAPEIIHNTRVERIVKMGLAVDEILNYAEYRPCDLIIMGTKGVNNLESKLLGTNTTAVITNVNVPVLVVPATSRPHDINNIVFAADLKDSSAASYKFLVAFASLFNAKITFLHVSNEFSDDEYAERKEKVKTISQHLNYPNMAFYEYKCSDPVEGINQFAHAEKADIICMATHHRSFVQRIFKPSMTAKFAGGVDIPLLAVPVGK